MYKNIRESESLLYLKPKLLDSNKCLSHEYCKFVKFELITSTMNVYTDDACTCYTIQQYYTA